MTRPVTLLDGTIASSSSEAWRHECEARALLDLPTQAERRAHLAMVETHRGPKERQRLEATARALWAQRRAGT